MRCRIDGEMHTRPHFSLLFLSWQGICCLELHAPQRFLTADPPPTLRRETNLQDRTIETLAAPARGLSPLAGFALQWLTYRNDHQHQTDSSELLSLAGIVRYDANQPIKVDQTTLVR